MEVYGKPDTIDQGVLYGGNGKLLAAQVITILTVFGWTSVTMGPLFFILNSLNLLRIPPDQEIAGMDVTRHGGSAYNLEDNPGPQLLGPTLDKPATEDV